MDVVTTNLLKLDEPSEWRCEILKISNEKMIVRVYKPYTRIDFSVTLTELRFWDSAITWQGANLQQLSISSLDNYLPDFPAIDTLSEKYDIYKWGEEEYGLYICAGYLTHTSL